MLGSIWLSVHAWLLAIRPSTRFIGIALLILTCIIEILGFLFGYALTGCGLCILCCMASIVTHNWVPMSSCVGFGRAGELYKTAADCWALFAGLGIQIPTPTPRGPIIPRPGEPVI